MKQTEEDAPLPKVPVNPELKAKVVNKLKSQIHDFSTVRIGFSSDLK